MFTEEIQRIVISTLTVEKAIRKGHFLDSTGYHKEYLINRDKIYADPEALRVVSSGLAGYLSNYQFEVIVTSTIGAAILSHAVYNELVKISHSQYKGKVKTIFIGRDSTGELLLNTDYVSILQGRKVALLEDVLQKDFFNKGTFRIVTESGARVTALVALLNRDNVDLSDLSFQATSLADINFETYLPSSCPLCLKGIEINEEIDPLDPSFI